MENSFTEREIFQQDAVLADTLQMMLRRAGDEADEAVDVTIFTGCGTSYYLAISAARFYQSVTGKTAFFVPASEIIMAPEQVFARGKRCKIVAISRSGTTTEIVQALKLIKANNWAATLAVTCHQDSPMANLADESISLDQIKEKSVVMTQSFSSMLYALQLYAAMQANAKPLLEELKHVPVLARRIIEQADSWKGLSQNLQYKRFIFLGTGINYGIACEATLKLKEMTQTECEAYSTLEFRHGPISVVDDQTVVVLFACDRFKQYERPVLEDVKRFGGLTVAIGNIDDDAFADRVINLQTGCGDLANSVLQIIPAQILAYQRTLALGYNPDQPRNLTQVVQVVLPGMDD
jgi:glucosamine--fructose-6-phosphate aminotransferase (isomerizing)